MSKKKISHSQKYALWRAYDMKCFYCDRPLHFQNLTIDHVIPESLDDNELSSLLNEYEILDNYPDFSVNDYCNWVPSDGNSCNYRKGSVIFPKTFTLFLLNRIQNNLHKVEAELTRLTKQKEEAKILGSLGAAIETEVTTKHKVLKLLWDLDLEMTRDDPLIITYSVNILKALEMPEFPGALKNLSYAILCNRLEAQLSDFLRTISNSPFHYTEQSHRDGEVLSVRIVFPHLTIDNYGDFNPSFIVTMMPWWELLELTNFYRVYKIKYLKLFKD